MMIKLDSYVTCFGIYEESVHVCVYVIHVQYE